MADISIIFSRLMVDAIRAGRKVQTRRYAWQIFNGDDAEAHPTPWQKVLKGDRLWVREACWIYGRWRRNGVTKAGRPKWTFEITRREVRFEKPPAGQMARRGARGHGWAYRHARYMCRWMSRTTLIITSVKVEPVKCISRTDAAKEGICLPIDYAHKPSWYRDDARPEQNFAALWDALHGAGAWQLNPEVVAMSFTVRRANIDKLKEAA